MHLPQKASSTRSAEYWIPWSQMHAPSRKPPRCGRLWPPSRSSTQRPCPREEAGEPLPRLDNSAREDGNRTTLQDSLIDTYSAVARPLFEPVADGDDVATSRRRPTTEWYPCHPAQNSAAGFVEVYFSVLRANPRMNCSCSAMKTNNGGITETRAPAMTCPQNTPSAVPMIRLNPT